MNKIDINTAFSKATQLAGRTHNAILGAGYDVTLSIQKHNDMKLNFVESYLGFLMEKDDFDLAASSLEYVVDNIVSIFEGHNFCLRHNVSEGKEILNKLINEHICNTGKSVVRDAHQAYDALKIVRNNAIVISSEVDVAKKVKVKPR